MSRKSLTQSALADETKMSRSWVTKLLKGNIDQLKDDHVRKLQEVLGINITPSYLESGSISPIALHLSTLAEHNVSLAQLLESLAELTDIPPFHMPFVPTKELPKIGARVTQIVNQWEQPSDPHYAKIGAEVLKELRLFYEKYTRKDKQFANMMANVANEASR